MKLRALICACLCLVLSVGLFTGCDIVDLNTVITINGEAVTTGEFNFMLDTVKTQIAVEMGFDVNDEEAWKTVEVDNKKVINVAKDKTIDEIVTIWVEAQKAKEEGITLTDEEVAYAESGFTSYFEQVYGTASIDDKLKEWQVTEEAVKEIFKKTTIAMKLENKFVTEDPELTNITEEEIQAEYENAKNEYFSSAITAKHILIMFENPQSGITRTKEEANAEAQAILDKINAGEDFDTLMRAHSEDTPESFDAGYTFSHNDGQMVQAFDDGAYALEVGEVSGLVETEYGYHIIKRLESNPDDFVAFEEVKDSVKMEIAYQRFNVLVKETWIPAAKVEKDTKILDKIK